MVSNTKDSGKNAFRRSRREAIRKAVLASGAVLSSGPAALAARKRRKVAHLFSFCLNTSTINGRELGIEQCIDVAAAAGYHGIEIWIRDLEAYVQSGGNPADLQKRAKDLGLRLESAIGFAQWIVGSPGIRDRAFDEVKRQMGLLRQSGCRRMAAPPAGATNLPAIGLEQMAERYARLIDLGREEDVLPQLEFWGPSLNLGRLEEALYIAAACGRREACILPDVYHMYKGGSSFEGLRLISGAAMHMFHLNDYPATPDRSEIRDGQRVYPGDGIAPLDNILRTLHEKNTELVLSLELFNKQYWAHPALEVAKNGLRKMEVAVARAMDA